MIKENREGANFIAKDEELEYIKEQTLIRLMEKPR
jgi:hypothetical protein